jgi:site-specific recombinase XerD
MAKHEPIQPLFNLSENPEHIGEEIIEFTKDDYNKETRAAIIDANNDAQAISSFLSEYKESPETLRSYAKEIERLLLWCIHISKINISSLRRDHLLDYQDFLKNPEPKKLWCGPSTARYTKQGEINEHWRPFVKGLSPTSLKKTIRIIDSFFNYLVQTNYLIGNPLAVDRRRKRRNQGKNKVIDRYLELDEIQIVLKALNEYVPHSRHKKFQSLRARYIIMLLFYTGLRITEAADHTMGDFVQREGNWFLRVIGKGKKLRDIPVPDELLAALADFRINMGLPSPQPQFREKTPLIPMQNLEGTITPRRIDQILKWAFDLGALEFELEHPRKASKLRSASAHWLRHSYVTYLLESGAPLKVAQENAGHSDIGTTMLYYHIAQTNRHEATRDLSLKTKKKQANNKEKNINCDDPLNIN